MFSFILSLISLLALIIYCARGVCILFKWLGITILTLRSEMQHNNLELSDLIPAWRKYHENIITEHRLLNWKCTTKISDKFATEHRNCINV